MPDLAKYQDGLTQIQAAAKFLSSLSGLGAGVSAILPLLGGAFEFVPMEEFRDYSGSLVTGVATMLSCFVLLYLVSLRDDIRTRPSKKIRRQALIRVALGLVALSIFLGAFVQGDSFSRLPEWWGMFFYVAFFVNITYAFALIGMKEFLGDGSTQSVDTAQTSPEETVKL
jgi:hypothetical protein